MCPCHQWSRAHPLLGTLVRHVMCIDACSNGCVTGRTALAPTTRALCMRHAPSPGSLVALCGLAPSLPASLMPAGPAAVAVTAVAAATQDDLLAAARAQVQAGRSVHTHPGTTEVLDGFVPARHTVAAPPSSARCRARYGRSSIPASQTAAAPTFFGIERVVPRHATNAGSLAPREPTASPAPAWPPCRAARLGHYPIKAILNQQALVCSTCSASKPPPHRRIVAVLDRRSHAAFSNVVRRGNALANLTSAVTSIKSRNSARATYSQS